MNKKGFIEISDLVGFFLIFVVVIIFGFYFTYLSPKARIEVDFEETDYLGRQELIDYLSYDVDGKNMADMIVLAVNNSDLAPIEKKAEELFKSDCYKLLIYQDNEILSEVDVHTSSNCKSDMRKHKMVSSIDLEDFFDTNIHVETHLVGFRRL